MRTLLTLTLLALLSLTPALAQVQSLSGKSPTIATTAPSGACTSDGAMQLVQDDQSICVCEGGTWTCSSPSGVPGPGQAEAPVCIALESPVATDNPFIFNTSKFAITITDIFCMISSGTSVAIQLERRAQTGALEVDVDTTDVACDTNGQPDDGTLTNVSIAADKWVAIDVGTVTGTVGWLYVCFDYERQ